MTYPSRNALISGGRGSLRFAGLACSRFSSSKICWHTPTHSLQMYERGYSEGELINFSTCSCDLWQKEQRSGSSGANRFTGLMASHPKTSQIQFWRNSNAHPATWSLFYGWEKKGKEFSCVPVLTLRKGGHRDVARTALAGLGNNVIHHPVRFRLVSRHDEVSLHVSLNLLHSLSGVVREQFVERCACADNFFSVYIDVRRLAREPLHPWLVYQHPRIGQRVPLFRRP